MVTWARLGARMMAKVDALWMDSAGAAGRLVEKLRTEKERERAGKNGAAISCKQNWSGRNKIPLWMPFCPVRKILILMMWVMTRWV